MLQFPATNDAPLALDARRDVLATAVWVPGRATWVLKDPVTLEQHELGEAEYLLLTSLGDRTSLRNLQRAYQRRFAPKTIGVVELQSYLGRLHRAGLLVSRARGQGTALVERAGEDRARRLRWSWTELLAIRLRGWNPDRMLDALLPLARPLLSPIAMFFAALLVLAAVGLLVSHSEQFVARLPSLSTLTAPSNWLWLAVTVAVVKLLHELAHGLVAKHMGAEVHEMGILLLVFVPTLYCDVTDIWSLASKWRRMAVSAAGMAMELVLASVATFVWWSTEPGLVNMLALNTMVVASVGTLLVNANPLMRYDGYYLLSDLCEAPNLWQRSRDALHQRTGWLFFKPAKRTQREPLWLACYGAMSKVYLTLVLLSIFWMAALTLKPLGLGVIAYALGGVMLAGVVARPVQQLSETMKNPVRRRDFRPAMSLLVLLVVGLLAAGLWRLPIADRVECQARVVPARGMPVVTTMAGRLEMTLPPGSEVTNGQVIARLASFDIERNAETLAGELRLAELTVEQLEALRARDAESSRKLPTARAALADAKRRVAELEREKQRLVLRAPRDGVLLPPAKKPVEEEAVTLASWTGSPLDTLNDGAWLEAGTTIGTIGDVETREVALAIDETDIERVELGQRVRVQLHAVGSEPLEGVIRDIARVGSEAEAADPDGLAAWLPSELATTTSYEARVVLDAELVELPIDSGGRAKVDVGRTTVGEWIMRQVRDTFR
ncbi:site-2 protease family protein [Aeoliella sp.]|uniref:site-2 protease family protein n=1 Tax=Aeoliella sp. TaxID=2795800 RepID=UPI003CCC1BCB